MKKDLKRINILGFDPLIYGSEEKIHHGAEELLEAARGCRLFAGDKCFKDFLLSAGILCGFIDIPFGIIGSYQS